MIKLVSPEEAERLRQLRLQTLQLEPLSWLSTYQTELPYSIEYFRQKTLFNTQKPYFGFWGNYVNDYLAGYLEFSQEKLVKANHIAYIYELCIDREHRHKGLASELISHVIELGKQSQIIEQIQLRVTSSNQSAISLYTKLGFEKITSFIKAIKEPDGSYQDQEIFCYYLV